MAQEWNLDVSTEDLRLLVVRLSPSENRVNKDNWQAAMKTEEIAAERLVSILTIVASALLWDVSTVSDSFPSTAANASDKSILPEFVSEKDLTAMNDCWQLCLSDQDMIMWHQLLDSSQNNQISRQSWSRSLEPFYAVINTMGHCMNRLLKQADMAHSIELFKVRVTCLISRHCLPSSPYARAHTHIHTHIVPLHPLLNIMFSLPANGRRRQRDAHI